MYICLCVCVETRLHLCMPRRMLSIVWQAFVVSVKRAGPIWGQTSVANFKLNWTFSNWG